MLVLIGGKCVNSTEFALFVGILRYPDGTWHIYSPDLDVEYQVGGNLHGDSVAIANMLIPAIKDGMLKTWPPMHYVASRSVIIKWLLEHGYEWEKVFIDLEYVKFKKTVNGTK